MEVPGRILVLGLGNRLLSDDAAGPLVVDMLAEQFANDPDDRILLRDGGTMGLSLLPEIEDAWGIIAVDAASFGEPAGTVRVFEGEAMDRLLFGNKKTAHEVALADLMGAAAFNGLRPAFRALVAVQPHTTQLGLEPVPEVRAVLPQMAREVEMLISQWHGQTIPAEPGLEATA